VSMGLVHANTGRADDLKVVPCRPTITCTADLAPLGELELEVGYQLRRVAGSFQHGTPILLKLPIAPWIEAPLGSHRLTYLDADHRYFDDVVVGAKIHLVDQTDRAPSVAVTMSASVPIAAQRGFTESYDAFATVHASKDLGAFHIDANVGFDAWQLDTSTHD